MTRDDSSEDPFDLGLEREFKFQRGFKGKDSVVTIKVTESFNDSETGIGGQVWSSSVKLASFLVSNSSNADREKGFVALELGAGSTGLVGISALQSLVAKYVYFSDLQGSLECLHENVSRNIEDRKSWELVELDWCMPIKMEIFQNYVPNLLLAAECLYEPQSVCYFFNVLESFPNAPCLLSGIIGDDVLETFLEEATKRGFILKKLEECSLISDFQVLPARSESSEITARCIMLIFSPNYRPTQTIPNS